MGERDRRTIEAQIPRLTLEEAAVARAALDSARLRAAGGDDEGAAILYRATLAWTSDAARFGMRNR